MDTGQITQGLRADSLQQNANGSGVMQNADSGFSFADIMNVIISNVQNDQNAENILDMQNVINGQNMEILQNLLNTQDISGLKNILNITDLLAIQNKITSDVQDISTSDTENLFTVQDKDEFVLQDLPELNNSEPEKILNVQNEDMPDFSNEIDIEETRNYDDSDLKMPLDAADVENDNQIQIKVNRFDLHDINIASDKFGIDKPSVNKHNAYKPDKSISIDKFGVDKNVNLSETYNNVFENENLYYDSGLSQKLTDIFGIISPEIMNNDEKDKKDIFDFSESVIKADPLQLAGLLDFISTGTGIPEAMDISDSQLFKNAVNSSAAEKISGKIAFDPEDMIKSGEMEIISYVPAENKAQSNLQKSQRQLENDEKTIDFARTMKSVKENVKPISSDEEERTAEVSVMTAEDMNNTAEKIDISFDRAYAELELNKAKYGSADQQLFKGISENLEKGRSEFTVKLRPEGLGEILVKLVSEDGGKAVLSMVASSEKTAQLLNRDLASLQSSLNQHNVEIENNSVKTIETVMPAQSAFNQYDERRQDEGTQQNQFRRLRKKLGSVSVGNVSYDNESEPIIANPVDSALNITI